ncbi:MAG: hypothetical protein M1490_05935 [Candidatus Bathyarchaeota archaeon]|nr:hypothetical protein [Candidatus Bathyarchaeota archaeon]
MIFDRRGEESTDPHELFYSQLPMLVERSLGSDHKARRARKEVITGLIEHPYYDPVLVAVECLQRRLLTQPSLRSLKDSSEFLGEILQSTGAAIQDQQGKLIRLNARTKKIIESISRNEYSLSQSRSIYKLLPRNYLNVLPLIIQFTQQASEQGKHQVFICITQPPQTEKERKERDRKLAAYNQWVEIIGGVDTAATNEADFATEENRDTFVDLIQSQPEHPLSQSKFFYRKYAGLSLADIPNLKQPLLSEDMERITTYVTQFFTNNPSPIEQAIVNRLFFVRTFFVGSNGGLYYRHQALFNALNDWSEWIGTKILEEGDPQSQEQIDRLLQSLPEETATSLTGGVLLVLACSPFETDPIYAESNYTACKPHPIHNQVTEDFKARHPGETTFFEYADEIGRAFYKDILLPSLRDRVTRLGVLDRYRKGFEMGTGFLQEFTFSEGHLLAVKEVFEKQCGDEFLKKLAAHASEINQVTNDAWADAISSPTQPDQLPHYLPLEEGIEVIDFADKGVSHALGLRSLWVSRSGQLPDWKVNLAFHLANTPIHIVGFLDQQGNLHLRAPIHQHIPGLFTMLRGIAVLATKDLLTQQKATPRRTTKPSEAKSASQTSARTDTLRDDSCTTFRSLPRRQTDEQLSSNVFRITGSVRRRVSLHKTHLPGSLNYQEAVKEYDQARESGQSETILRLKAEKINQSRRQFRSQPSTDKLRDLPSRFQLESVKDPLTGDTRYLETWVVEHTSPKPAEEELRSPVKLYERYYRGSSSLAFLEQLLPWFVDQ